jgi:hypothetical protein
MNRVWMCAPRGGGTRNYLPRVGFELGSKRNLRRFVEDAELAASRVGTNGRRRRRAAGGVGMRPAGEVGEWDGWIGRRNQLSSAQTGWVGWIRGWARVGSGWIGRVPAWYMVPNF